MDGPASHHVPMDPPDFCNPSVIEERLKRKAEEQRRLLDEAVTASREIRERRKAEQRNLTAQMQDVIASRPFRVTQHNGTCAVCARHSCRFGCPQYDGPPPAVPAKGLGVWQRFLIWLFGEPPQKQLPAPQHRTFIIERYGFGGRLQRGTSMTHFDEFDAYGRPIR